MATTLSRVLKTLQNMYTQYGDLPVILQVAKNDTVINGEVECIIYKKIGDITGGEEIKITNFSPEE
jgi:hypothetical protein